MIGGYKQTGGFTLIEVVMASVCTTIVLGGLASCLVLAGHAFNKDRVSQTRQANTGVLLDRILNDLRYVKDINEHTATAITFNVPDRDGDSVDETIRYSWSGSAGDPILMEYNGSDPMTVIESVHDIDFTYHLRSIPGTGYAQGEATATPFLINSHVDAPGGRFGQFGAMPTYWYALYLEPNVPSGTTHWDFTQLQLSLKQSAGADGYFAIQVCLPTADANGPSTVLQELVMHEDTLQAQFQWYEYNFDEVTNLSPDQALFIVIKHAQLGGSQVLLGQCEINIDDQPGYAMYHTQDVGATYQLVQSQEIKFYAYGVAH